MAVTTLEGRVQGGRIVLKEEYKLPEAAQVYVVFPESEKKTARVISPRLVEPSRITEFEYEVFDADDDEIQ